MELLLRITEGAIRETRAVAKALSNEKRIRLLVRFDASSEMSLGEIHRWAKAEKLYPNKASTYRALERLVSCGLLSKKYDSSTKKLVYSDATRGRD